MKEDYLIIGKHKIYYQENFVNDNNEVLVFLPGWGASLNIFSKIFPQNKNWLALDFPNFGKSSKANQVLKMEDYAQLTKNFLDKKVAKKQSNKITFVVHSFGGRVILKMLDLFPDLQPKKIIFMGTPFFRTQTKKVKWTSLVIKYFHKIFSVPILNKIKPILQKPLCKFIYSEDYLALQKNPIMQETFKNTVKDDLAQYLHLIQNKEVYLIWGENDQTVPPKIAQQAHQTLQNSQLHIIKKSGHFPFLENTEEFLEVFNKILV